MKSHNGNSFNNFWTFKHLCPKYLLVIGGLLCFLPLMLQWKMNPAADDGTPIVKAIHSRFYQSSLVSAISIAFPMLVDYLIDSMYQNEEKSVKALIPRRDLILALIIPDVVVLAVVEPYSYVALLPVLFSVRQLFYVYSFLSYMENFNYEFWSYNTISPLIITFTIAKVLSSYGAFVSEHIFDITNITGYIMNFLAFVCMIYLCLRWLYYVRKTTNPAIAKTLNQSTIYVISILIMVMLFVIISLTTGKNRWTENSSIYFSSCTLMFAIFTANVSILNGRIVRKDAAESQQALELKKMFVRYISHEIRTPLNTVFLGLKLLEKEILDSRELNDRALSTVRDVKVSCNVSLEILNDLLTFDKLESGILKLEGQYLCPWLFVRNTVKPFYVQAREAGIEIEFESFHNMRERFHSLSIEADPYKLAQVIRNLVSNALKFTPRGGRVTIVMKRDVAVVAHSSVQMPISRPTSGKHHSNNYNNSNLRSNAVEPFTDGDKQDSSESFSSKYRFPSAKNPLRDGDIFRMEVIDTGAGISPENQTKLFKEIVQFHPGKLQGGGGSGLGLYITKGIVDLHNGSISVWSAGEGHGCTFTLELPLFPLKSRDEDGYTSNVDSVRLVTTDHAESKTNTPVFSIRPDDRLSGNRIAAVAAVNGSGSSGGGNNSSIRRQGSSPNIEENTPIMNLQKITILIADDSKMNRRMVLRIIESRCEKTVEAENGLQAVNEVKKSLESKDYFDIILMDHRMPVMDGPDAVRAIRSLGYKGYIIGVTGNALAEDMEVLLKAGADFVMAKPLDMDAFNKIIAEKMDVKTMKSQTRKGRFGVLRSGSAQSLRIHSIVQARPMDTVVTSKSPASVPREPPLSQEVISRSLEADDDV